MANTYVSTIAPTNFHEFRQHLEASQDEPFIKLYGDEANVQCVPGDKVLLHMPEEGFCAVAVIMSPPRLNDGPRPYTEDTYNNWHCEVILRWIKPIKSSAVPPPPELIKKEERYYALRSNGVIYKKPSRNYPIIQRWLESVWDEANEAPTISLEDLQYRADQVKDLYERRVQAKLLRAYKMLGT